MRWLVLVGLLASCAPPSIPEAEQAEEAHGVVVSKLYVAGWRFYRVTDSTTGVVCYGNPAESWACVKP